MMKSCVAAISNSPLRGVTKLDLFYKTKYFKLRVRTTGYPDNLIILWRENKFIISMSIFLPPAELALLLSLPRSVVNEDSFHRRRSPRCKACKRIH